MKRTFRICRYRESEMKFLGLIFVASMLSAQWLSYPTAGVPKLSNGQPNLTAPTPRTPDGRPDFSGLWDPDITNFTTSPVAGAAQLPPEFNNIGARLKDGLPYRPEARAIWNARQVDNRTESAD